MFDDLRELAARLASGIAPKTVSKLAINSFAEATPPRPRPFSLWSDEKGKICDYTSWASLTDRHFSGRHLRAAPESYSASLPEDAPYRSPDQVGQVTDLFRRTAFRECPRSTLLFPFFAQWFTDSFLRVDISDRRKNTSNHEIDLCQIYGLTEATTRTLRSLEGGRLRSSTVGGAEYPDTLFGADGEVKEHYRSLPYAREDEDGNSVLKAIFASRNLPDARKEFYFASGLERGNSNVGYTAMSTLFLREHNRLAGELKARNPSWDDERLFQTARNINIVLLLKIVIEDYINHISPIGADIFRVDPGFPEDEPWYRTNWIALEFDLLYRWHGLVTDNMRIDGTDYGQRDFRFNNKILTDHGLGTVLESGSRQSAGRISLQNTPTFLLEAEYHAIKMGRDFRLRGFNEYRVRFGLDPLDDFDELTGDPVLADRLLQLYGDIDNVEFFIGLFAEDPDGGALFGELMTTMVAHDAFTQALTNPLLSKNVFNRDTFTPYGMKTIRQTSRLSDLVARNVPDGEDLFISLSRPSQEGGDRGAGGAINVGADHGR